MIGRIALALTVAVGLALGLWGLLGSPANTALADAGILHVAPGGDCGGATPCYATVQAAVDAAVEGDTIKIAAGTYADVQSRPAPAGTPTPPRRSGKWSTSARR